MSRAVAKRVLGLSLLELLVALALFSVVAALAYGGLSAIATQRAQAEQQSRRLGDLQRAVGRMVADLRATLPRPVREPVKGVEAALLGRPQSLEFTRAGASTLADPGQSGLERVGWRVAEGRLLRDRYATLDRTSPAPLRSEPMLDPIRALRLSYIDRQGRRSPVWPTDGATDALPAAVEVELEFDDGANVRRVVEIARGWR